VNLQDKTIAVTGASGFIGSFIALDLLEAGAKVRGVVRTPEKAAWLAARGGTVAKADLADVPALTEAFRGADAIVANAALYTLQYRSWKDFVDANVKGTENTLDAAAAAGVKRMVYVSTCGVYKPKPWGTITEDSPRLSTRDSWWFLWSYPLSKAIAEDAAWERAKQHGIELTVVRPGGVFGPRDFESVPQFTFWMKWPALPAVGFRFPFSHGGDVARGIRGALLNDASVGHAYNLSGEDLALGEVIRAWKRAAGHGPWLLPSPLPLGFHFDNSAAKRDLGFANRPLDETMRDIHDWIAAGRPTTP
jgi:nucleoside-diphosphate-sugar epimerase